MGRMNGIIVIREIVARGSTARLVVVTNCDDVHFREAAVSAGVFAFVSKENLHELIALI